LNILVTGHKGMLGKVLYDMLEREGHKVKGADLPEQDLTQINETTELFKDIDFIYNCAAYTDVDGCETDQETAMEVNGEAVKKLALYSGNIPLLHISTDYVFNGNADKPYLEDDPIAPVSLYGKSKAAGEKELIANKKNFFIVRTAWLYGYHGSNFIETIIKLSNDKDEIKVVNDQKGAPTNVEDLAEILVKFINCKNYGIYHFTNSGETTWFNFAKEIVSGVGNKTEVVPCSSQEFVRPAVRPQYSVLDLEKIKKEFKIEIPGWQDGLHRYLTGRKSA